MLRLSPGIWGKVAPLAPADTGWLNPVAVHRATIRAWDDVVVISIPSHDYTWKAHFDSLLNANRSALASAQRLIVDLRGNEGGGSQMVARLHPYLVGDSLRRDSGSFADVVMLSSPDQIAYARRAFGADTSAFVRRLIAALESAPGTLVPLYDASMPAPMTPPIIPIYGPRQVAVLVDGGTVSASEVTVQLAKRGGRAVVYGENTAGALDYQSTSFARLAPDESRWFLLYPTITASANLPAGGMRGVGIAPDVPVRWSTLEDPIAYIAELLRAKHE
jgi:C-terminal processing protease CtpA/Prc